MDEIIDRYFRAERNLKLTLSQVEIDLDAERVPQEIRHSMSTQRMVRDHKDVIDEHLEATIAYEQATSQLAIRQTEAIERNAAAHEKTAAFYGSYQTEPS